MLFSCWWSCCASPKYRKRGPDPSFSGDLVAQRNYQQPNSYSVQNEAGRPNQISEGAVYSRAREQYRDKEALREREKKRKKGKKKRRNMRGLGESHCCVLTVEPGTVELGGLELNKEKATGV